MPTTEELLEQLEQEAFVMPDEQVYCVIDPDTRQISVPSEYQLLGVESDEKAGRIWFQCPKIVGDNIDLSQLQIRVNYQNANSQKDQYIVTDVQSEDDNIIFSWLLSRKVTAYRGSVSFIVCAVKVSGETIQNEWNTTLATSQVLQGLEVDDPEITEEESDVIAQLLQIMTDTSEQAVADVGTAKTSALEEIGTSKTDALSAISQQKSDSVSAVQSAQSAALSAVENAGELIKESLPSDYTELSNKVDEQDRTKAPAITESTSGESIQLSDSGDAPLTDIKLYGKSKQDGEPSPDNPVEIEIPGSDGNVEIETTGANLYGLDILGIDVFQDIDAKANQKLYLMVESVSGISQFNYRFRFSDGTVGGDASLIGINLSNGIYKKNVVLRKDVIGIAFYNVDSSNARTIDKVMVAISDTALPYEPYKHTSATLPTPNGLPGIPVTSGGNYTDADGQQWICDEIDFKRGKYVRRVAKYVPAEQMLMITNGGAQDTSNTILCRFNTKIDPNPNVRCAQNNFVSKEHINSWSADEECWNFQSDGYLDFRINKDRLTEVTFEAAKQFCSEIGAYFYYALGAPIETNLSQEQLSALKQLRTYQTVTNITTDSEPQVGMEVEYTADTKTYIDNKFAELAQSLAATQNTLLQEV